MNLKEKKCTKRVCKVEKRRRGDASAAQPRALPLSLLRQQAAPAQGIISQRRNQSKRGVGEGGRGTRNEIWTHHSERLAMNLFRKLISNLQSISISSS